MMTNDVQKQEQPQAEGVERTRPGKLYVPRVDIYATEDEMVVVADMPGVDETSVDITLEKNLLTITGTVTPDYPEGYNLAYSEYGIGDFQRSFTISNEVDRDKIEASVSNGVLSLHLPKAKVAQTKKITVKAG